MRRGRGRFKEEMRKMKFCSFKRKNRNEMYEMLFVNSKEEKMKEPCGLRVSAHSFYLQQRID